MLPRVAMLSLALFPTLAAQARAADLPKVRNVELQPLAAQVQRLLDALDFLGAPLPEKDTKTLREVGDVKDKSAAINTIQDVLDAHCLAGVRITSRENIETFSGPARPELAEQGWRIFLVKVHNQGEVSGMELRAESPAALPVSIPSSNKPDPKVTSVGELSKRFMELNMFASQPLTRDLSGLELEYRILQVYSRDAGRREANLG